MSPTIYIDGQEGTTGLRLHDLLAARTDLQVLKIDPDKRKDPIDRQRLLNAADVAILCLPDAASREAVALVTNPRTKIIDASTAFRTHPDWAYGLPELSPAHRAKIQKATRVAVPGCHASAFILALYPLIAAGILPPSAPITAFSLTGYSGGGKKMIADYENKETPNPKLMAPRHYALKLSHKHIPEMQHVTGLANPPVFTPVVCNIHSGLAVEIFLPPQIFPRKTSPREIHQLLVAHYAHQPFVQVMPFDPDATGSAGGVGGLDNGFLDITACNGTNRADLFVVGHEDPTHGPQTAVLARLDNLGKGAAGAAIQNLNLLLNLPETTGLAHW